MGRPRTPGGRAKTTVERLAAEYPGGPGDLCELDSSTPWELLVATVLSAQTTDVRVNLVTPGLFARYPTPAHLAAAEPVALEEMIRSTGFYRSKARSLLGLAFAVVDRFDGQVPTKMADLVTLPGVGRKTANVVRSVALGEPGLPVDTHVTRLVGLLGLTTETDAVRIETAVGSLLPKAQWGTLSLRLILHGRRVCIARRPRCEDCVLADFCPSAQLPTRA
ncbi:MAG: endonuclease III [Actinomycetota bacterium]|nr:endonuclease III [Actinomycetota bacterium]MDQ6944876.1 endonuclease III [Actinomycetota bacterium]